MNMWVLCLFGMLLNVCKRNICKVYLLFWRKSSPFCRFTLRVCTKGRIWIQFSKILCRDPKHCLDIRHDWHLSGIALDIWSVPLMELRYSRFVLFQLIVWCGVGHVPPPVLSERGGGVLGWRGGVQLIRNILSGNYVTTYRVPVPVFAYGIPTESKQTG